MKSYLSLIKFSHTVFAMPFAMLAFFLGMQANATAIHWGLFALVICCMVFARSAAMAFNRFVDRRIDAQNLRTAIREIPAGVIRPTSALWFVITMSAAFIITTYWINPLCFLLSPIALLVILGYSYTKRFTWLCHFVLGLGLGLAPVGAFIAVTGSFDNLPVYYGIMVLCWVSGFDILYALQDEAFDKQHQLHSVPGHFGKRKAKQIALLLHVFCAVTLIGISWYQGELFPVFGWLHWLAAFGFIALLIRQHWLVHQYDLAKINQAFFETNGLASIFFGVVVILDIFI